MVQMFARGGGCVLYTLSVVALLPVGEADVGEADVGEADVGEADVATPMADIYNQDYGGK